MIIGFIGAGNMAGAMIAHLKDKYSIVVFDPDESRTHGLHALPSGDAVAEQADVVVLAVKPQMLRAAAPRVHAGKLVISIAAGKPLAALQTLMPVAAIVRAMPNLAASVGAAVTAMCAGANVTSEQKQTARAVLESIGIVLELEEKHFSVFTALSGCSPAFALLYMDALAAAGVRDGLPKNTALTIAAGATLGAARLLQESGAHPRHLIDQVCSPGGTTIEGMNALRARGFEAAVDAAVEAALRKDKELQ